MSTMIALPWLTASPKHVLAEPWLWGADDNPYFLPECLPSWDAATDLVVRRIVQVQAKAVREDCGLQGPLRLSVVWWCPGTGLGRRMTDAVIPSEREKTTVTLEGVIAGKELAERIILRTLLVRPSGADTIDPLGSKRPGSILWEDRCEVTLEGTASRFPTEVADFGSMGWPVYAGWHLSWDDPQLDAPFRRAVRLYLNVRHEAVCRAAAAPSRSEHRFILAAIRFDIAHTLLAHGLNSEEFVASPDSWPEESVGDAINRMLLQYFPHDQPAIVAKMLHEEPSRFSTHLQSAVRIFEESA